MGAMVGLASNNSSTPSDAQQLDGPRRRPPPGRQSLQRVEVAAAPPNPDLYLGSAGL